LRREARACTLPDVPLSAGDAFDRYRIEGLLGEGGWGEVYKATDTRLRRVVALKVLRPERKAEAPRFLREARAAASLHHPNVVSVYDTGEASGVPFIAMELVVGRLLSEFAGPASGSTVKDRVGWLVDVARGLQASHEAGLLHRDIKPQNVIVTKEGRAKLVDFGLAKQTEEAEREKGPATEPQFKTRLGYVVGSPRYMAPEALEGAPCDGRADQYSWGVTAYEILSGVHPRAGLSKPVGPEVPRLLSEIVPDLSFSLAVAVARTLAYDAGSRFPDMAALIAALEDASRGGDEMPRTAAAPAAPLAERPTEVPPIRDRRTAATRTSAGDTPKPPVAKTLVAAQAPADLEAQRVAVAAVKPSPTRETLVSGRTGASPLLDGRKKLLAILAAVVTVGLGLVILGVVLSASNHGGPCAKDVDCKGDRVCERGTCVYPLPGPASTGGPATRSTLAERQAWLDGPLLGRDNAGVPMGPAKITPSPPYKVTIEVEKGFTCSIDFDGEGRPTRLSTCTSTTGRFSSPTIPVHCTRNATEEQCWGPTGGIVGEGESAFAGTSVLTLLRRLRPGEAPGVLNCNPPYTVDGLGRRVAKPECL
jgi:serine/threonine protein kinase